MFNDTWLWKICIKTKTKRASKTFYCKSCLKLAMSTSGPINYTTQHNIYKFETRHVFKPVNKDVVLVSNCHIIHCEQCESYLGFIRGSMVTLCRAYAKLVMFNDDNSIKFEVD